MLHCHLHGCSEAVYPICFTNFSDNEVQRLQCFWMHPLLYLYNKHGMCPYPRTSKLLLTRVTQMVFLLTLSINPCLSDVVHPPTLLGAPETPPVVFYAVLGNSQRCSSFKKLTLFAHSWIQGAPPQRAQFFHFRIRFHRKVSVSDFGALSMVGATPSRKSWNRP